MKFGPVSLADAKGGIPAHSLNPGGLLSKNGSGEAMAVSAAKGRVA